MKIISSTLVRKNIKHIIDEVRHTGEIFVVGRHQHPDVVIIPYPQNFNRKYTEITNINANSSSFDFLKDEPDLYTKDDLKEMYV